ncbi:MAG: hypothetical protein ABI638_11000 [Ignavibacteriota bacterium]
MFIGHLGVGFVGKKFEKTASLGTYSLIALILFLVLIYISNLVGPPPPSIEAVGIVGSAQWLIVLWGYWIDKNRG